ncbi:MAG: tripartite tricarboxylate transporter substrate binding protein [Burkholderiales bacterium]|nr:tripartite tricarboxylate transporter substrate binding protein [Burkholderiales bacterium]
MSIASSTRGRAALAALALGASLPVVVAAQAPAEAYPARVIRVVNSLAAGSSADHLNRALADGLSARLNQRVIVENRPGDGGNIAAMTVVKAAPDGYTLLMASTASLAIQMTYNAGRLDYDLRKSLLPVSAVAEIPNGLFVTPVLPVDDLKGFVARLKAGPGKYTCASSGVGGLLHLTCELFKKTAGVDVLHVPFKGSTAFRPELIEGRITMAFDNVPVYVPLVAAGKLKVLAVTAAKRAAILPSVPTAVELGVPELISVGLFSLFAPLNTPAEIVTLLNREAVGVLADPKLREPLVKQGMEPGGGTPQALRAQVENEVSKWARVLREANISKE